jgi:hypothetical protein
MSMRKSSRSELWMLRQMMVHFGLITPCCFCEEPLLKLEDVLLSDGKLHIASRSQLPIRTKLTVHHEDGNHQNNAPSNRKPCHQSCHKSYEMKLRRQKLAPPKEEK